MRNFFFIVPQFLKDPHSFFESVQKNQNLGGKSIAMFVSAVLFLMVFGLVTGLSHSWQQGLSTALKMPILFLLTLLFTLPALYFFSLALLNVRFSVSQALVVVLSGIGVSAFLLLGLAPVTFFFVLTSSNYAFFQLLAVVFVAISGFSGLHYILEGFQYVDKDGELSRNSIGNILLKSWVGLYGFVGAQMTWRLSPLIGDPRMPFFLFRPSRDNFFVDVFNAAQQALGIERSNAATIPPTLVICSGFIILALIVVAFLIFPRLKTKKTTAEPQEKPLASTTPTG
jgi:hypothetical protein